MKKLFYIFAILFISTFSIFAKEGTLFDVDKLSSASIEEFSFADWEIETQPSLKAETAIKSDTVKGLGALVVVPTSREVFYKIIPPYSAALNEADIGVGFLENVGDIKSIEILVEGINRNDEVSVFLSRSMTDLVGRQIKFPGNVRFIGENTLKWENPNYIADPARRIKEPGPAYGNEASNLYLRGIGIRTTLNDNNKGDVAYSIVYIKKIKVIYDLDKTEEELEIIKSNEDIWGVNNKFKEAVKEKDLEAAKKKKENKDYNEALMDKIESTANDK